MDRNLSDNSVNPELFANYVPLNALSADSRNDLAKKSTIGRLDDGAFVFRAGDIADKAFFLLAGEIQLTAADGRPLARLKAGDSAAVHRLAHQSPRRVSARCISEVQCLAVDAALLDVMLTWDQTGQFEVADLSAGQQPSRDDWMVKLLQKPTFQRIPAANLQAMFMRMQKLEVAPGQVVVRQGDVGDYFYVILEGRCGVSREQPNQKPVRLAELEPGTCFGEEALISDAHRNATVTMLTQGSLMRLKKQDFGELLKQPLTRRMSYADAQKWVTAGKARWLDVRLPSEFQNHCLPGSLNLPLYMLRPKLATLDPATSYVCVCDTGRRSSVATYVLVDKGYDAYLLEGGLPH